MIYTYIYIYRVDGHMNKNMILFKDTRCSPRTRMLTPMLMVQMSKHIERNTYLVSSAQQDCAMRTLSVKFKSVKCGAHVWRVKCKVSSVECGV